MKTHIICALILLFSQVGYSKVVDIHVKTPSEIAEEERQEQERQNERDRKIFEDETKSEEERREALGRLVENEEIV